MERKINGQEEKGRKLIYLGSVYSLIHFKIKYVFKSMYWMAPIN